MRIKRLRGTPSVTGMANPGPRATLFSRYENCIVGLTILRHKKKHFKKPQNKPRNWINGQQPELGNEI